MENYLSEEVKNIEDDPCEEFTDDVYKKSESDMI